FGHSDARVRVTAPLIVRAVTPRLLRPDDEAELAAMIENLGGGAGTAELELVVVKGAKLVEIVQAPAAKVVLAAGGQARLPFRVRAKRAGTVELELRVRMPGNAAGLRDAVRVVVPIERSDALRQHAASYGSVDRDGAFAIALGRPSTAPQGALDVEVELAPTMLAGLEPMARDLATYPYGCVEQTTSGLLPLIALKGLAQHGWLDVDVDEHLAVGIARLRSMQLPGGALGYWPGATTEHVWGTAYALWVLEQLHRSGYEVPVSLRKGMRDALRERLGAASTEPGDPWDRLGIEPVAATIAVQALVSAGERPIAQLDALFAHREELPSFARALLLMAAHEVDPKHARTTTLLAELREMIDEREGTASVRPGSSYYDEYFDSSARTDAMALLALDMAARDDVLVEKLARGLGELRHGGALENTQERAYALLALATYGRARESVVPELTAELWIDGKAGAPAPMHGRKASAVHRKQAIVPGPTADEHVTVRRMGKGRLYWRVGMSWTPPDAGRTADAHGVAITRELRTAAQSNVTDVTAGELVAMDVTVTVDKTQRYLAIDLPLPPGLEAVDDSLGAGARARVLPAIGGGWVSHRELRRDRAVLFADVLRAGEHTATVFLRATTPGRFAMPAAVAHAMYSPERRGHAADVEVVVAPR
ncbi:MAG: alpha-2-macroglobulin, partial [Deltaproteobacteria bacterium]|nr:alpha-2-macroglobulin [Nannocystaceae bacterium]